MTGSVTGPLHLVGRTLPDDEPVELWVVDGVLSTEFVPDAVTICESGWILPGLVDAHCHVGIRYGGGHTDHDEMVHDAQVEREAGVLLLRDAGSPVDTRILDAYEDLPRIIRAGRHLARPKRYIRELSIDLADPQRLPEAVAEQARAGDGWVKLVGDWIDRDVGDLAPLWSSEILHAAIGAAHAEGARVTAHVFGEQALVDLIDAGIDCIEHGTGLTDDTIEMMVAHDTALVPTLINIDTFPQIADGAAKFPRYAAHMRDLHRRVADTIGRAHDAGVRIFAGTDAGSGIRHGRISDEISALIGVGLTPLEALGAASWDAREWLGRPGLISAERADLVVYRDDPRTAAGVPDRPDLTVLGGRVF